MLRVFQLPTCSNLQTWLFSLILSHDEQCAYAVRKRQQMCYKTEKFIIVSLTTEISVDVQRHTEGILFRNEKLERI